MLTLLSSTLLESIVLCLEHEKYATAAACSCHAMAEVVRRLMPGLLLKRYGRRSLERCVEGVVAEKARMLAKILCDSGVQFSSRRKKRAIEMAASLGYITCVTSMLEHEETMDHTITWCWITTKTAFLAACRKGHLVEMLCARFGADVHADNDLALRGAAQNGHIAVVEMLCARFGLRRTESCSAEPALLA